MGQARDRVGRFTHTLANPPRPAHPHRETRPEPTPQATPAIEQARQRYEKKLMTTTEVARLLGVTNNTVAAWCTQGYMRAVRVGKNGHWRINADDVHEYVREGATPTRIVPPRP